jgi:phospholipid/cholesterol/gamma-HCH transport system substrate-binding protein
MSQVAPQAIKAGLLVGTAIVLLTIAVFVVGEGQNLWQRKVDYEIHFSRTNGLLVGAPVALSGVNVGSVVSIDFPPHPLARYISVQIEVGRKVMPRIRKDTVASIRTQGILGDKYIELAAGTPASPPLDGGAVIPELDPVDYEAVLGQSGDIVANIVELTASLRNVLQAIDQGEGLLGAIVRSSDAGELTFSAVHDTVTNLAAITERVEKIIAGVDRGEGLLGALVRDTDTAEGILVRLNRSAENLDRFAQRMNESNGLIPRLIEDRQLGDRITTNLETTTDDLADVAHKIRTGEGTLGLLINDRRLYDETTEFVRSTRTSWTFRLYRGIRGLWPFGRPPSTGLARPATEAIDPPAPRARRRHPARPLTRSAHAAPSVTTRRPSPARNIAGEPQ